MRPRILSKKIVSLFSLVTFIFVVLSLCTTAMLSPSVIKVPAGGDLQVAINAAQPGDIIILEANADYVCDCRFPVKDGSAYVTIKSSRADEITGRAGPSQAHLMARVRSTNSTAPTFATTPGSHHFRLVGLEILPNASPGQAFAIVRLGSTGSEQDAVDEVPHHFELDRVWIHGGATQEIQRGIALNSAFTDILNSTVEAHGFGYDTQAICGWNGPGPFRVINNALIGAGENIMFGGADPSISGLVPTNIQILRNHVFKPLSWRVGDPSYAGVRWSIKNLLELKNARDVLIDGNLFENSWLDAQTGIGILIKSSNDEGGCTWCVSERIVFSNNIVRHVAHGLTINAAETRTGFPMPPAVNNVAIVNNLFYDVSDKWIGPAGSRAIQIFNGARNITIDHVTFLNGYNILLGSDDGGLTNPNFTFTNSIVERGPYGIGHGGGEGAAYLDAKFSPYTYGAMLVINSSAGTDQMVTDDYLRSKYPAGTLVVTGRDGVGFVNWRTEEDYRGFALNVSSPFKNRASDGKDLGVDFVALESALSGQLPTPSPSPSVSPSPAPSPSPSPSPMPSPSPLPSPVAEERREVLDIIWPSTESKRSGLWQSLASERWNDCFVYNNRIRCWRVKQP